MDNKPLTYVVRSFEDFKDLVEAGRVNTVEDVDRIIAETYPEGLNEKLDKRSFGGAGCMIGFNLRRYVYTDKVAAELHVLRDRMTGEVGYSYGMPFKPHIVVHEQKDDRPEHYEVYTG